VVARWPRRARGSQHQPHRERDVRGLRPGRIQRRLGWLQQVNVAHVVNDTDNRRHDGSPLEAPADRIAAGPEPRRERPADDGHGWRRQRVLGGEGSAAQHADAHRLEVAGADPPELYGVAGTVRRALPVDLHERLIRKPRREPVHRRACFDDSGDGGDAFEDAFHGGDTLGSVGVPRRRQLQLRRQNSIRVVPGTNP